MNRGKRKIIYFVISIELIALIYIYQYPITNKIFNESKASNYIITTNRYSKYFEGNNLKLTKDFNVKSKEQLYDVILTIINSGQTDSTFYCNYSYSNCINSIKSLNEPDPLIEEINNIVHPYNNFKNVTFEVKEYGVVNVHVEKMYNNNDIVTLNNEVDRIYSSIIKDNMDTRQKIQAIHDYIVNNSEYDEKNANLDLISDNLEVGKANNILLNHIGLCGSYTDTIAIFLNKMGLENYKISSDTHVWNYVKLDKFYHIDVTWDDPITSNGSNLLTHDFFLLTTEQLLSKDNKMHNFNTDIYKK